MSENRSHVRNKEAFKDAERRLSSVVVQTQDVCQSAEAQTKRVKEKADNQLKFSSGLYKAAKAVEAICIAKVAICKTRLAAAEASMNPAAIAAAACALTKAEAQLKRVTEICILLDQRVRKAESIVRHAERMVYDFHSCCINNTNDITGLVKSGNRSLRESYNLHEDIASVMVSEQLGSTGGKRSLGETNTANGTSANETAPKSDIFLEWDTKWQSIGRLKEAELGPYRHVVGLYRHELNGKIKYIGRALELDNGGLAKRLSDYRRPNDSARKHTSGRAINDNLEDIETSILIVGDTEDAVQLTRELEPIFIKHYNPEWNKLLKS